MRGDDFLSEVRKTCAFTGHRPKKLSWGYNEADARCVAVRAALERQICLLIQDGVTDFLSGMAEGIDLMAAQIVLDLRAVYPKIKLHCILPHKGQEKKWSLASQKRYRAIMEEADSMIYVSRIFHKDCMLERNRFLVAHSDVLVAVYNGEYRGGTAATIRYAQKLGRRVIVLDPNAINQPDLKTGNYLNVVAKNN